MKPKCGMPTCGREHYAKGYCQAHYNRKWYTGKVSEKPIGKPVLDRVRGVCKMKDCENPHFAKKLCQSHYLQVRNFQVAEDGQAQCQVDGCKLLHSAKGYCFTHYGMAKALNIKSQVGL